jgi:hypothetical protein
MSIELDHLFLWVSVGGPEADQLVALGLSEGQPNRHPGQGTACRRFFFANAYLELLWVENTAEAQGEVASPLRLWERWSGQRSGACPFGLIFRPALPGGGAPPFPSWEYRPPYLPPPLVLHVGENTECLEEPLLFYFPVQRRPASSQQPLEHRGGFGELTALRVFGPRQMTTSAALQTVQESGVVALRQGPEHLAEIGFDGERQGQRADLRPALPLVVCW